MLRMIGKMFGGAIAVLCLASTLAVAVEMTCTASDGKGNCTAATGPDGKPLVVVGEGVKVGEKMDCEDRGYMMNCHAVATEMTCAKDDGKGNCMEATGSDGHLVVVVGENLQTGDKMTCVDTGTVIHCAALVLQK
jgi:hypothetical protein